MGLRFTTPLLKSASSERPDASPPARAGTDAAMNASFVASTIGLASLLGLSALGAACGGSTDGDLGSSSSSSSSGSSGSSSGADGDASTTAADDAGTSTESVCTSGKTWTRGDRGSELMHPGVACIECHAKRADAPRFTIAGTVYPTEHEPDNCNGASGTTAGAKVVITGADGKELSLPVNSVGNFYTTTAVAKPFKAKVVAGGKERAMTASQTVGDCNSCHTETGANNAPGRIALP